LILYREAEHQLETAWVLKDLGRMAFLRGDDGEAIARFAESLTLFGEWGYIQGIAWCLDALAGIVGAQGQPERAVRLLAAAEAMHDSRAPQLSAADRAERERTVALVRAQLDEATFAAAWAEGRAMTLEQVLNEALTFNPER
jgi:hypothetical protein